MAIASRLDVSPRTVHRHLDNAYRKLGVHDRLLAVGAARRHGVICAEEPEQADRVTAPERRVSVGPVPPAPPGPG